MPSAPLRNTVRRIAREAWRAAWIEACGAPPQSLDAPVLALLRLRALPVRPGTPSAEAAAAARAGASKVGTAGSPVSGDARRGGAKRPRRDFADRLTDRALRRALRAECDRLMGRLARESVGTESADTSR